MNQWRRYVYLVAKNFNLGTYPLRRISASSLFYPINHKAKATVPPLEESLLPRPYICFAPSRATCDKGSLEFFGFFGCGNKKSVLAAVDYHGVSLTYDVEDRAIHYIASPDEPKFSQPVSVAVGDALYVMNRQLVPGRGRCFEALTFGPPKNVTGKQDWDWRCLQPPPIVLDPDFKNTRVHAYTVVDGASIWISLPAMGTYSFDTVSGAWSKVGDWELPFHGRGEFFPEYGAWLGFSGEDRVLCCSSDIGASVNHQPTLGTVWDDPNPQWDSNLFNSHLVHLGSGKFCIAKFFEKVENELTAVGYIPQVETFVVLTGVVLKPSGLGRGLEMTPHKSLMYRFQGLGDAWAF